MRAYAWACFCLGLGSLAYGQATPPKIKVDDFYRLQKMIRPQKGESPWRRIPWRIDLEKARRQAAKENKPLLIFTAADGNPLNRA